MIEIEAPAIFLSFDDFYVHEWYDCLSFFDDHNIKVTFYLTPRTEWGEAEVKRIQEIEGRGHTIGFHTTGHFQAVSYVEAYGCEQYLKEEIHAGLDTIKSWGIQVRHFAYPYGSCSDTTHKCLDGVFDTLRGTFPQQGNQNGIEYITENSYCTESVGNTKVLTSFSVDLLSNLNLIEKAAKYKRIVFCYSHSPNHEMLKELVRIARKYQCNFYPMSVLNR